MITFNWRIEALEYAISENKLKQVIKSVSWVLFGEMKTDGDPIVQAVTGVQQIEMPKPEDFIPYDQVTEQIIIGWLEELLPVDSLKKSIEASINEVLKPKTITVRNPFSEEPQQN